MRDFPAHFLIGFALWAASAQAQELTDCTQAGLESAITVNGGLVLIQDCSISLSDELVIASQVTLQGAGTNTINANGLSRIFNVEAGGLLQVNDLTFTGGKAQLGGAVLVNSNAVAIFSNCVFSANSAVGGNGTAGLAGATSEFGMGGDGGAGSDGTSGLGGAVFNAGNVTFLNCRFVGNTARGGDGGAGGAGGSGGVEGGNGGRGGNGATGRGGALYNTGTAAVRNSTLQSNTAIGGNGAAGGAAGTGPYSGTAAGGGYGARGVGAGICNVGDLEVLNSTIYTNTATGGDSAASGTQNGGNDGGNGYNGGGAFGAGLCNLSKASATNCTIVQNRAIGGSGGNGGVGLVAGNGGNGGEGFGGGLYNTGVQWLMNCTLAQNGVTGGTNGVAGQGVYSGTDGKRGEAMGATVFGSVTGNFQYKNTIFAYPTGSTNGTGYLTGIGNNISSDTSVPLGPGSIRKDPKLHTLADNGGPTLTMMPQPGSPAINAGDMDGAPDFDQRGMPRPATDSDAPDIGSVEVQGPDITTQPTNQTAFIGATAVFSVSATGDTPLSYIWSHSGTNLSGATLSAYTITNVTAAAAGPYTVLVSNALGATLSQVATLTVTTALPPVITSQPVSQTVAPGTNVTFNLVVTGTPPLAIQWRSNSVPLANATNSSLVLQNVQTNFTADYSAQITNRAGSVTSSVARLTVVAPVTVVAAPSTTNFAVAFSTKTGLTYVVEYKNLLSATTWTPIATNTGTGLAITNLFRPTNSPSRFYRVRAQ